jgi:hypothetical protein
MAEFVRAQIFGTTFEITSRYVGYVAAFATAQLIAHLGTPTCNPLAWEHSDLSGTNHSAKAHSPVRFPN